MSGARPKVYAGRSSSSSSDNHEDTATPDTAALCRLYGLDPGKPAISSRDAQADQESRVFIIHAGEDKESFVRPLVTNIQQQGVAEKDIFFDDISIQPGEEIRQRIISTLSSQSLELAIIVVSTSLLNKHYWPKLEFETCLRNNKHIFPIWVDANNDNFKAFSELVGKYSPTLKQLSARRVQRDEVTDELPNIAAEIVRRLSSLQSTPPEPGGRKPKIPSTEQLDWLKRYLKRLYRTKLGEFQPLPWFDDLHLHLKDVYTNLQVVRKDRADRDLPLRRSGRGETGKRSSNSARDSRKDPGLIRIEQIFDVDRNGEVPRVEDHGEFEEEEETEKPKRIRIEGPPGIGKSIQCRKLACDWSSGSFQQFDFAFLLQMRYFSGDVKDAIFDQLLPEDTEMDREALWSYIRQGTNQPKVLFILDGLDELKPQVRQTSDVIKLIQQRVLTDATVVITSRPNECTADLKGCPLHCNITGYTLANSKEYIHKYFKGRPELANSLGARIDKDKNLAELATNPLNTMLLCIIWEDNDGSLPSTITSLFDSLVLCIVKRYCKKNDITVTGTTIPDNIYTQLAEMGKVAWKGLLRNEVNFDEADFQSTDRGMEMFRFGFLTKDLGASRIDASFVWSFLHKTFQEYFAAVCLSKDADMQKGSKLSGSVPTRLSAFIPHQLYLVEPRARRQQANAALTESGLAFKDRVLQSLKNDNLHQVCLFLVGILKTRARAVFECFLSHLQTLGSSCDNNTKDEYRAQFLFCVKCLIESENGPGLVRVISPCFPKTIDVSDLFAHAYDNTWRSGLILILDAECPWVTRVDINLTSHSMTKELAAALARSRFVTHLSIIKVEIDDMSVTSSNTEQQEVPLLSVLERAQSIRVFFAQIYGITASNKDLTPMTKLFRAMSLCTPLSSIILFLHMDDLTSMGDPEYDFPVFVGSHKLHLPVDLLASSSTLSTCKLWVYGSFRHHHRSENYVYESDSDGGGVYGGTDDELDYYICESVDDQAFNESIGKLLCESKSIQTFSLKIMYRCIVFRHADKLPSILASMLSVTEVLRHIVLHFSFYHKQRDREYPITYNELTRLHIFMLIEALSHNRTLRTFELFIDDDVGVSRKEEDSSSEEDEVDSTERPCQDGSNQSQSPRSSRLKKTDQDHLWPSIASVFQNNTVLHTLNLTFRYCLTDSPESVQRMADAVLALSGNSTLHTVKLALILYKSRTTGHFGLNASAMGNVDTVFRALGNVVSTNTTLKCLHFHKADDPLHQRTFSMLFQSDKTCQVTVSKPVIEQLASATQRNMVLKEFSVVGFSCEDEGAQELIDEMVSSARDNLKITFSIS